MEGCMSRLQRQSFLGEDSEAALSAATVGIVGLGGGGSHAVQQFAHIGIGGYVPADPQTIDKTNTNRLIGGTLEDVRKRTPKVVIARRLIRGLQPRARIHAVEASWQSGAEQLKQCDLIIGAVDSFKEREQLERFARRYLIPYIDIGMDVHELGPEAFLISGQVILSMPGCPCLRCCGLITDERLKEEAKRYGAAGGRPQVVWPNGVLASTAVGLAVQLLTPWFPSPPEFTYLEYDGNRGTVSISARVQLLKDTTCPHHPRDETGDPFFDIRQHISRQARVDSLIGQPWRSWLRRLTAALTPRRSGRA
jgi:hypothetical protein